MSSTATSGSITSSIKLRREEEAALQRLCVEKQLTKNGALRLMVRIACGLPVPSRFDGLL